ncbi:MAG: hypothetical protein LRY51_06035 [Geovibrio sp.]|nr:hypothetical protein [Geovibrio sp.]
MKELFNGVVRFRDEDYADHRELFENLGDKQAPHTLFVGCSDSRVVPNLITRTMPGRAFCGAQHCQHGSPLQGNF